MKCLVTGAGGFAGRYLCEELMAQGHEVTGTYHWQHLPPPLEGVNFAPIELTDPHATEDLVRDVEPNRVYHLAAVTAPLVMDFWTVATIRNNTEATTCLLTALRRNGFNGRLLLVSSSHVYGDSGRWGELITEGHVTRAQGPYAASKIMEESLAQWFADAGYMDIVISRAFNHTGVGQLPLFAVPAFVFQSVGARLHGAPIKVGNLEPVKDFSDVRDIARGYTLLLERGQVGEIYHLASERAVTMREVLHMVMSAAGLSDMTTVEANTLNRVTDISWLVGDSFKARALGYKPQHELEETIEWMVDYAMQEASAKLLPEEIR